MFFNNNEISEYINIYNIGEDLKSNKEILRYLRKYYNHNKPIITNKRLDKIFFIFKEDMINKPMDFEINNILKKIINK